MIGTLIMKELKANENFFILWKRLKLVSASFVTCHVEKTCFVEHQSQLFSQRKVLLCMHVCRCSTTIFVSHKILIILIIHKILFQVKENACQTEVLNKSEVRESASVQEDTDWASREIAWGKFLFGFQNLHVWVKMS